MQYDTMDSTSSFEIIRRITGDKWKFLIISYLFDKSYRFGELLYHIDSITKKVLTENLRELEDIGIISRNSENENVNRLKVTYSLTELGYSLHPILNSLILWSLHYASVHRERGNESSGTPSAEHPTEE